MVFFIFRLLCTGNVCTLYVLVLVFSFRIIANLWQPKSSFRFHSDIEYDRRVVNNFYCIFWQLLKTGGTFTNTDSTSPKSISRKIRFKRQTPNTMRCTCPVYGTVVILLLWCCTTAFHTPKGQHSTVLASYLYKTMVLR